MPSKWIYLSKFLYCRQLFPVLNSRILSLYICLNIDLVVTISLNSSTEILNIVLVHMPFQIDLLVFVRISLLQTTDPSTELQNIVFSRYVFETTLLHTTRFSIAF